MSDRDTDASAVLHALKNSLDHIGMHAPAEQIVAAGRARQRRRLAGTAAGVVAGAAAITGATLGLTGPANPATGTTIGGVHIRTVAYTVDSQNDGTVRVSWDKQKYFEDHEGLQQALRSAGFPVLIKEGEFCRGPQDPGTLSPSGSGPGVETVVKAERRDDGGVTFVYSPAAMPAGTQLFIGYLTAAQRDSIGGNPGSVERLVPTDTPLICTTQPPPPHVRAPGGPTK